MKKRHSVSCRFVSLFLAFALMLTLLPVMPLVTGSTASAASQPITIYFKDTDGWGSVNGYAWDNDGNPVLGSWPGTALAKNEAGLYVLKLDWDTSKQLNFIFNSGSNQTADKYLTASNLASSTEWWLNGPTAVPTKYQLPSVSGNKVTFTYTGSASTVKVAGSFNSWSGATMTKSGSTFTYTTELAAGQYEYKFIVDGSWINDPCNPLTTGTDYNNYFVMPGMEGKTVVTAKGIATQLPAELTYTGTDGSKQLTAVTYSCSNSAVTLDGTTATVSSSYTGTSVDLIATNSYGSTATVTLDLTATVQDPTEVIVHFSNTLGWSKVCAHLWSSSGTLDTTWPGKTVNRDGDGFYTLKFNHSFFSGESMGLLFHNNSGAQTADISISASKLSGSSVELWVQPTGSTSDEKYTVTTSYTAGGITPPYVFGDGTVTFNYTGSASTVYLAGSFNNWSTSATKLTKVNGVWTTTVDLEPGVYEYKYIVNGSWVTDPKNALVGGYDENSILVVPDGNDPVDTGKITVVLHFYRSGTNAYNNWDVWFWGNEASGAGAFSTQTYDKGRVASFTIDGRTNSSMGYVVRKTDWSDKEFYDRFIDLSDVVSGTVHYFLNSGSATGSRVLGADVVMGPKATYANLSYDTGKVWVQLSMPHEGALTSAFTISGPDKDVYVTGVTPNGNGYDLTLSKALTVGQIREYSVLYNGCPCGINIDGLFYSSKFAADYTYSGDDLGVTYTSAATTFKVWAPTATNVHLKLYKSGNYSANDQLQYVQMTAGDKGVWSVTVTGDLKNVYYNFDVSFPTYTVEATDPYADAAGVNGDRGMIVDLDSTDPTGWNNDVSPNKGMNYTDAIIYEMHVREFTIDSSSGVDAAYRGKYLGLTQDGTNYNGYSTGLAHLKELGVTHVQLMPVFDFSSVDEYHLTDWAQYAWGYDPKNFNVPEGGYSTDPYNGATRITEFKQMVQSFHSNGINVVMDVVYNHTFDGGNYCGNKIVPNYYSRFFGEGNWSNGSGVGNDVATERSMVRNMIVNSIMHWVEEYHIDGFRFDLAGLIDVQTVNQIVSTVHAKYPNVIFYGEGWAPGGTAVQDNHALATQGNAWQTGGFGYFNDSFRESCVPNSTSTWGFATGSGDLADAVARYMRASTDWSTDPSQLINYTSCHDNYCLTDKIILTRDGLDWYSMTSMNRLSAAMILLSQGVPFIYSGDEILREKKDGDGNRYHNGYGASDEVTKLYWSELQSKQYAQLTDDYYAGLIAFRKNHAALRSPNGADIWNNTVYTKISNNCVMLYIKGGFNYECSSGIVIILNSGSSTAWVDLYNKGLPSGTWNACIHGDKAGTDALWSVDVSSSSGNVGVDPYSATVLVLGDLIHEQSVYNENLALVSCSHTSHNTSGNCTKCGANVGHSYGGWTQVTAPSCTTTGTSKRSCACGASETKTIPAQGHSYKATVTAPTCTEQGYTTHTCGTCGDSYTDTYVDALDHEWTDWVTTKDATCTEDGAESRSCTLGCGTTESQAIPATDHSWTTANCIDPATCSKCGATDGAALGHSYSSEVTKAPTCSAAGIKTFTCSGCGDSYTESMVKLSHTEVIDAAVDATCTESGLTEGKHCEVCGEITVAQEEVAALGHSYADGICGTCGEADPDYVKPIVQPVITVGSPSVSFEGEIRYNIYFSASQLDDVAEMGLALFNTKVADGTVENADQVIPGYSGENGSYMVQTDGIAPKNMGDALYFRIYAKLTDGSYVYTAIRGYNAIVYANNILKNSTDANMRSLVVAMLNYGAAAQQSLNYKTDSLMNAGLTAEHQALVKPYDANMMDDLVAVDASKVGNFAYNSAGFSGRKPSVSFDGAFAINYYFTTKFAPENGMKLYYWTLADYNAAATLTAENASGSMDMTDLGNNQFWGHVEDIVARDIDQTVFVAAVYTYGGVEYATGVLAYSVGSYCESMIDAGNQSMIPVCSGAAVYGYYAKEYFNALAQ